jgi:hypothetical protein
MARGRLLCGIWLVLVVLGMLAGCARSRPEGAPSAPAREEAARKGQGMEEAMQALRAAGDASGVGQPAWVKTYQPDGMYEAIDGEADLFLSYDCRGLAVARYQAGAATVDAEVFDQSDALDAFGVYSQLRRGGTGPEAIGAEGVKVADEGVFFWKSRYFVRVSATSSERPEGGVLVALARSIAAGLEGPSRLPAWTTALPGEGREGAVEYVARNVLGQAFLSRGVIGEYRVGGEACRLVLVRADDEAEAQDWQQRLRSFYQGAAGDESVAGLGSEAFVGADRRKQAVRAVRSGRHLVLVIGDCGAPEARRLLDGTLKRLDNVGT